jgi:hypothetical protein
MELRGLLHASAAYIIRKYLDGENRQAGRTIVTGNRTTIV